MPAGRRRQTLVSKLDVLIRRLFAGRLLAFDEPAALAYAPLVSRARRAGRLISVADGQIAAIATVGQYTVATRDVTPFAAAGVPVINPWSV